MDISTLLADPAAIQIQYFTSEPNSITLVVKVIQSQPCCPKCERPSSSLHSNYQRTVADLPWYGVAIKLLLHTRKFRCKNPLCSQKVFCERLPKVVAPYARKTVRLNAALTLLAFALGGEAGARTACRLNLKTSGDTLIRRIRQTPLPEVSTPKALGIDDWAKQKGQSYGTILVDLQQRRPIDLLPDRESQTLAAWLKAHPGIEVITRDRAGAYAEGARIGAPDAKQVADRWHLLKNAREALERLLHRNHKAIRQAYLRSHQPQTNVSVEEEASHPDSSDDADLSSSVEPKQAQQFHEERRALYELVKELQRQGLNINQIRLQLDRHHTTVARFFRADVYPEIVRSSGSKVEASFIEYLNQRWTEGCQNAAQLYRELRERGYRGSSVTIRRVTKRWRSSVPILVKAPPPKLPTPKALTWLLLKPGDQATQEERRLVEELLQQSEAIKQGYELIRDFWEMVRGRKAESFTTWLEAAGKSKLTELENFATGLKRDEMAVRAALSSEWSNGQSEGQINRLKFIKRQMFGRAKLDLLKARVLHPM